MSTPRLRRGWGGTVSAACILAVAISGTTLPLLTAPAHAQSQNAGGNAGGGDRGADRGGGRSEEARGGGMGGGGGQGRSDQAPGRSGASGGGGSENAARGNAGRGGNGGELRLFGQTIRLGAPGQGAGASRGGSEQRASTRAATPRSTAPTARAPMTSRAPAERPARGAGAERHAALAGLLGAHPSELGALNAARASEQAFANAAPESRVGRIAAYRDAVLAGEALAEELDAARAALETLPPSRSADEIQADLDSSADQRALIDEEILVLQTSLVDADEGDIASILEEIAALEEERDALLAAEETLLAEAEAAAVRAEAEALVAELEEALAGQPATERDLLEAAANKPVTDAVEAEVRRLLGLD
jgi:hypothetical protein